MRIAIGADHAGFLLKEHLKSTLKRLGHQVEDLGTHTDASVDYPPICAAVGRAVTGGRAERGIVLGGSGQGEQMAANKVHGIRAALCNDEPIPGGREGSCLASQLLSSRRLAPPSLACRWPRAVA